jgi:hypothetical protein
MINSELKKNQKQRSHTRWGKIMLFSTLMILTGYSMANAQRVKVVEPDNYPQSVGALNKAIEEDNSGGGGRANDIYVLRRGGVYWLDATINHNFHLHIRAEDGEGAPPIIRPAVDLTGTARRLFQSTGHLTLEGVYLSHLSDQGNLVTNFTRVTGDNVRVVIDNCWLEFDGQAFVSLRAKNAKVYITNTKGRNVGANNAGGNGRIVDVRGNDLDSLIIENSTFYNIMYSPYRGDGGYANYIRINHNTFMDAAANWEFDFVRELEFTNNQFANMNFRGTGLQTNVPGFQQGPYPMSAVAGVFRFATFENVAGLTDNDRIIRIENNNMQFSWDELRLSAPIPFYENAEDHRPLYGPYDPIIQEIFDNNPLRVNTPLFDSTGYTLYKKGVIKFLDNVKERDEVLLWVNRPDLERVANFHRYLTESQSLSSIPRLMDNMPTEDWMATGLSFWRNLTYSRDAVSFTSAKNGYPIGDLNWFPDMKARWESGEIITSIENVPVLPTTTRLIGNYPNPFNPTTNLMFQISSDQNIGFEVYNTLGQKVKVIEPMPYNAGIHEVTIDAISLSSGIYLIRMSAEGQVYTHKMTLIK